MPEFSANADSVPWWKEADPDDLCWCVCSLHDPDQFPPQVCVASPAPCTRYFRLWGTVSPVRMCERCAHEYDERARRAVEFGDVPDEA